MPRVIRMALEYDGTRYHGFGLQPGRLTVQAVVEAALAEVLGHAVRVTAAGRTDAGVHAGGQVLSFRTEARLPAAVISRALNAHLPEDVVAGPSEEAEPTFDARRCARRRHYRYSIWNAERPNVWLRHYSLHVAGRLDEEAMQRAAEALVGRHDFTSFIGHAAQEVRPRSPVRTIERADWRRDGDLLHFDCSADSFGRHMVRNMVGTLLRVGRSRSEIDCVRRVLEARDRCAAGPTAPSRGLTLMRVDYDEPDSNDDQECQT